MIRKFTLFSVILFFIHTNTALSQISTEGNPIFKDRQTIISLRSVIMPKIKTNLLKAAEQEASKSRLKTLQYAKNFQLNLTPQNSGQWDTLSDGRRVWRLALTSSGAYSIGILFSRFHLPEGAKLFLYNNQSDRVLGAYTSKNNKIFNKLAIEPLKGDNVIVEYIEPPEVLFTADLEVGTLTHDFRDIFKYINKTSLKGTSGSCNVNINCAEGSDWQREKNSVCYITYKADGYTWLGSGALINNTRNDGHPYFLTAHHVLENQPNTETAIFYFNYESSECGGTSGPLSNTISGASIVATTSNLDFSLVELTTPPPEEYRPYYAGWDITDIAAQNSTCIHHPSGDVKKISKDFDPPITDTYFDIKYDFNQNTHWKILEWDIGTTEGGSSGSPLFDKNHRIIGDLTGGEASCGNSVNDYYAKTSNSWADYPEPSRQLKHWLDPEDMGAQVLNGINPYSGPYFDLWADFLMETSYFCAGQEIIFTNNSYGDPDNYFWEFGEDATPKTKIGKGPHRVIYQLEGRKDIKLTINKGGEESFVVKSINVNLEEPVIPDFSYKVIENAVTFINTSLNAETIQWNFGDGVTSNELNPQHEYNLQGKYTVSVEGGNVCGSEISEQEISTIYEDLVEVYPNPTTNGKIAVDLRHITYGELRWGIYDAKGKLLKTQITADTEILEFDLSGQMNGVYFIRLYIDQTATIVRKIILTQN